MARPQPLRATNLAWSLAQTGSVLLLDADPQGSARD